MTIEEQQKYFAETNDVDTLEYALASMKASSISALDNDAIKVMTGALYQRRLFDLVAEAIDVARTA